MMNLFKLSEQLKDFSKDQLVQEMKAPSGAVPQYLILSELQRRTRMEREAASATGPEPTTVAQDAVAAAGMPQAGLAGMAQAMAPQTDMAGNTGIAAMAPPVERMQTGGEVEGPNTSRLRSLIDLQRALEEARVQSDVNAERIRRAGRTEEPRIADVSRRVRDFLGTEIDPVDEFGGLPTDMTLPGAPLASPEIADVEPSVTGGRGDRVDTRRELFEQGDGPSNPLQFITDAFDQPPGTPPAPGEQRQRRTGDYMDTGVPLSDQDLDWLLPNEIPEGPDRRSRRPGDAAPEPTFDMEDVARQFEEEALADDRARVAQPAAPGGAPDAAPDAAPGGAPGGGSDDYDRMYEQDRWLALARFGLGLMSSREPTLGGAIGEAGAGALDYMTAAREGMLDRRMQEREMDLQERALAQRAASAGGRDPIPATMATMYDDEVASLREMLNDVRVRADPDLRMQLQDRLDIALANQQYARQAAWITRGYAGPNTDALEAAPSGPRYSLD